MSEHYSKKMVEVPSYNLFREQDTNKQPVLDVRNLGIDFGGLTAVDGFSITIGPTEISGLIGPNGAGKTTIFNLLTSVYQPTRGSILLNGIDTKGMTTAKGEPSWYCTNLPEYPAVCGHDGTGQCKSWHAQ